MLKGCSEPLKLDFCSNFEGHINEKGERFSKLTFSLTAMFFQYS